MSTRSAKKSGGTLPRAQTLYSLLWCGAHDAEKETRSKKTYVRLSTGRPGERGRAIEQILFLNSATRKVGSQALNTQNDKGPGKTGLYVKVPCQA